MSNGLSSSWMRLTWIVKLNISFHCCWIRCLLAQGFGSIFPSPCHQFLHLPDFLRLSYCELSRETRKCRESHVHNLRQEEKESLETKEQQKAKALDRHAILGQRLQVKLVLLKTQAKAAASLALIGTSDLGTPLGTLGQTVWHRYSNGHTVLVGCKP